MADKELEFFNNYAATADRAASQLGIEPEALLSQWALETGYGKSIIPGTNNLGNIKDFSGGGVRAYDKIENSNDAYRQYDSTDAFADDYVAFLRKNPRYKTALTSGKDSKKLFQELQKAGYATDPDYAKKLSSIYDKFSGGSAPVEEAPTTKKVEFEGNTIEVPADATEEEIMAILEADFPAKKTGEFKEDTRGFGTKMHDMALNTVASTANLLGAGASLINPDSSFAKDMSGFAKDIKGEQISDWAKDFNKLMGQRIKEAQDAGDFGVAEWLKAAWANPTDIIGSEAMGSLIPMAAVGKAIKAYKGTAAALKATAAMGAGLSAGEVRKDFYEKVINADTKKLMENSPRFAALMEKYDGDELRAKRELGTDIDAKMASGMTVAGAVGWIAGKSGAEALVAGKAASRAGAIAAAQDFAKHTVKEAVGEFADEATSKMMGNIAGTSVDPDQKVMDQVVLSGVQGAVTSAPVSVGAGLIGKSGKDKPQEESNASADEALRALEADVASKMPPQLVGPKGETSGRSGLAIIEMPGHPGVMVEVGYDSQIYKLWKSKQKVDENGQIQLPLQPPGPEQPGPGVIDKSNPQGDLFAEQAPAEVPKQGGQRELFTDPPTPRRPNIDLKFPKGPQQGELFGPNSNRKYEGMEAAERREQQDNTSHNPITQEKFDKQQAKQAKEEAAQAAKDAFEAGMMESPAHSPDVPSSSPPQGRIEPEVGTVGLNFASPAPNPQTQTPQFKAWFGDGHVVNEQGQPKVVYTGTSKDADFTAFKAPKNGIWFSTDPTAASDYAKDNDSKGLVYEDGKYREVNTSARVMPVFVSLKNPKKIDAWPDNVRTATNYRKAQSVYFDQLKQEGYDGVMVSDGTIVAFNSKQIKSAIGNNGNFNPTKNEINLAQKGIANDRKKIKDPVTQAKANENISIAEALVGVGPNGKPRLVNELTLQAEMEGKSTLEIVNILLNHPGVTAARKEILTRVATMLTYLEQAGIKYETKFMTATEMLESGVMIPGGRAPAGFAGKHGILQKYMIGIGKNGIERGMPLIEIVAHELVHAATQHILNAARTAEFASNPANAAIMHAVRKLGIMHNSAKTLLKDKLSPQEQAQYLQNMDELLAYGLTNPRLAEILKATPYKNSNLFTEFVAGVLELFGIKRDNANMLGELMGIYAAIAEYSNASIVKSAVNTDLNIPVSQASAYNKTLGLKESNFGAILNRETLDQAMVGVSKKNDISESKLGTQFRPGLRHLQVVSNHPLVKYANTLLDKAFNLAQNKMKQVLDDSKPDSFVSLLRGMPQKDRETVYLLLQRGDQLKAQVDPEVIPGLTQKQKNLIKKHYEVDADIYKMGQETIKKLGLREFADRPGHTPGSFRGALRALVQDKDGNVIGFIGENLNADYKKALQWVKDNHPGAKITELQSRQGNRSKADRLFEKLLPKDGTVDTAAIEAAKLLDASMFQMDKRAKDKLGIWGNEGNKPWQSREKNSKSFFENLVNYYEEAYTHHALQEPLHEIEKANTDYVDVAPNAVQEINRFIDTQTGVQSAVGSALDSLANALMTIPGFDKVRDSNTVDKTREAITLLALGFGNVTYMAAQLIQPLQTALPRVTALIGDGIITPMDVSRSLVQMGVYATQMVLNNIASSMGLPNVNFISDEQKAALAFMEKEGISGMMSVEHKKQVFASDTYRGITRVGEWNIKKAEQLTRAPVFMAFFHMLRNSKNGRNADLVDVLETAKNLTQYTMVDYNKWQRPQLYANLGVLGSFLGTFQTFKHGVIGQGKSLINNGNPKSFVVMAGVLLLLAGGSGFPGVEEADWSVKKLRALAKKVGLPAEFKSIKEFLMDLPPEYNVGLLSTVTGLDMSAKYSMGQMIPDAQNVSAQVAILGKVLVSGYTALGELSRTGQVTTATTRDLGKTVTPNSLKQMYDELTSVENRGDKKIRYDKKGMVKDVGPMSEDSPWLPLHQSKDLYASLRGKKDWEIQEKNMSDTDAMKQISEDLKQAFRSGDLNETLLVRGLLRYAKLGGNVDTLTNSIVTDYENTRVEKGIRGVQKGKMTPQKVRQLSNQYRNYK